MKSIESYNNICVRHSMAHMLRDRLVEERKRYVRLLDSRAPKDIVGQAYDGMPKGCMDATPLPEIIRIIEQIDSELFLQDENIKYCEETKRATEEHLNKLDGLEAEVYKMHVLQCMTLKEVADRLGYSHQWIKEISQRVNGTV